MHDHATARVALVHPGLSRSSLRSCPARPLEGHLLNTDGSQHQRLRAAVGEALDRCSGAVLALVRPVLRRLVAGLDGEVDVAAAVVRPVALVLVDALLGLSDDAAELPRWHRAVRAVELRPTPAVLAAVEAQVLEVVEARRQDPRDDAVSHLVHDGRVADDEMAATVFFLLSAGYVNTANFLGLALVALARAPQQWDWLRRHPDRVSGATEELLRYCEPTARASLRVAGSPVVLGGQDLPAGATVWVHRASAGRDARQWTAPDVLDLARPDARRSLAFGAGPHYCLGAPLVRSVVDLLLLELVTAVEELAPSPRTPAAWDLLQPLPLCLRPPAAPPGTPADAPTDLKETA